MTFQSQPLSEQEHRAVISACILAAFADGSQSDVERAQIERIISGFPERLDLTSAYQDVLSGKITLDDVTRQLTSPASRALAYEMAVGVCHADGIPTDGETAFLTELKRSLALDAATADSHQQAARTLAEQPLSGTAAPPPVIDANREAQIDGVILNAAILNGALEIMPHSLATMAIVPLQMRMVYQIGRRYGYELDRGHVKDFLATVGVGLTSQVFEGYAQRLMGGLARGLAGGLIGGLVGEATGSAFAFASTYALGQVARRYYAGGRSMSAGQLKDVFSSMLQEGRSLQSRYSGDISQRSRQVNISQVLSQGL